MNQVPSDSPEMLSISTRIARKLTDMGIGMRAKLILLFTLIKVVPLILLAVIAWWQMNKLGEDLQERSTSIVLDAVQALERTGKLAVNDAVTALDEHATSEIERMSTDAARAVANFLYDRDADLRVIAGIVPNEADYRAFVGKKKRSVVIPSCTWELDATGKFWKRSEPVPEAPAVVSSNKENSHSFHHRPPDAFLRVDRPLYHEITFVDLTGQERIKVTTSDLLPKDLRNVSDPKNTYAKAEHYFEELKRLQPGEIYVSEVIGPYVRSNFIGMYTPDNLAKVKRPYDPEKQAYAGMENPNGIRFRGIVRWAMPVEQNGRIVGYVTLALDHDHIMEFVDRLTPVMDRYTELPDANKGNYAFIWDFKGRSICHPRHHSIVGYDPETGDPEVPWLEDRIYAAWKESGKRYVDFILDVPKFHEQSNNRKPAREQLEQGLVGLDCRYLNFAPQCTGWFDTTEDGGSGSFRIFWSGLWKLNTAAAIPYYTGQYGKSKRGFGFVAVGAGLEDFHRPAKQTEQILKTHVAETDAKLKEQRDDAVASIASILKETALSLSLTTFVLTVLVIFIAIWLASVLSGHIRSMIAGLTRFRQGERHFRFNAPVKDEMGQLADSFDILADSIVQSYTGAMCIVDEAGLTVYMNDQALEILGKSLDDVVGKAYAENALLPVETVFCPLYCASHDMEAKVYHNPVNNREYLGQLEHLTDEAGNRIGNILYVNDVTSVIVEENLKREMQLELDNERALVECVRTLLHTSDLSVAISQVLDRMGGMFHARRSFVYELKNARRGMVFVKLYEWHNQEFDALPMVDTLEPVAARYLIDILNQGGEVEVTREEMKLAAPDIHDEMLRTNINKIYAVPMYSGGVLFGFIAVSDPDKDIQDKTMMQSLAHFIGMEVFKQHTIESLRDKGQKDGLTGVGNRTAYLEMCARVKKTPIKQFGIIYIDLNDLKYINDHHGHKQGDEYICAMCSIFQRCFRSRDIFRIGGDEFVIVCDHTPEAIFRRKVDDLLQTCDKDHPQAVALGSIWVEEANDIEALALEADKLMYAHKQGMKKERGKAPTGWKLPQ